MIRINMTLQMGGCYGGWLLWLSTLLFSALLLTRAFPRPPLHQDQNPFYPVQAFNPAEYPRENIGQNTDMVLRETDAMPDFPAIKRSKTNFQFKRGWYVSRKCNS